MQLSYVIIYTMPYNKRLINLACSVCTEKKQASVCLTNVLYTRFQDGLEYG